MINFWINLQNLKQIELNLVVKTINMIKSKKKKRCIPKYSNLTIIKFNKLIQFYFYPIWYDN